MRTPRTILQRLVTLYDNEETITDSDWREARASLLLTEPKPTPPMTPYWTRRQGKPLNRKLHTKLRRNILYASPWVLCFVISLGVSLWLISIFN